LAWVSKLILDKSVSLLEELTEILLGGLGIDLRELLHFKVMLANEMLLLLGKVSQVASGGAGPDLTRWD
jgi:hypothetical protein